MTLKLRLLILPGSIPAGENSVRNFAFAFAVGLVLVLAGRRVRDAVNYFDEKEDREFILIKSKYSQYPLLSINPEAKSAQKLGVLNHLLNYMVLDPH